MSDYMQELIPPEYRNLVVNPGGEESMGATWVASNGIVVTGSTEVTPLAGTGVVEYAVTSNTSSSYYFGPLGPEGIVHANGFAIPSTRKVSGRINLRANTNVWVRLQVSWMVLALGDENNSIGLREIAQTAITSPVQIGAGGWASPIEFQLLQAQIPDGVTHWRPLVAVFSANPTTTPTAPVIGTKVFADQVFITDHGDSLTGVTHVDGERADCVWEGEPWFSSSRTYTPEPELPPPDEFVDPGIPPDEPPAEPDPLPDEPVVEPTPPEPHPDPPDPNAGAPALLSALVVEGRDLSARAKDAITWESRSRDLCMLGDIQLSDLTFNTIDNLGVTWIVNEVDGWWTLPEPDVPDNPRGWFDGSYDVRGRYNSRTFTITGHFFPRHETDVAFARDKLIRAVNLCHKGNWFMTHEGLSPSRSQTRGSKVWLAGAPMIQTMKADGKTDFSIVLRAPDPVKYSIRNGVPPGYNSVTMTTSNSSYPERAYPHIYPWKYPEAVFGNTSMNLRNEGNTVVWPILKMSGPTNGSVVITNTNTEQKFRIVKQLYPGETLVIDCQNKQVTLNGEGNYRFFLDVDVDWLMLQPGSNMIYFSEETLGGIRTELEVQWRSGWIG